MAEIYNAGTVAVVQGSKTLVLTGGVWTPFNVRKGDIINLPNGYTALVESVTDTTHLEMVLPFDGADANGLAYAIVHGSVEWGTNVEIHHAVVRLLDSVENPLDILFGSTVPNNNDGENKQLYIRDNVGGDGHGDIWKKVDGVWQLGGNMLGPKGDKGDKGDPGDLAPGFVSLATAEMMRLLANGDLVIGGSTAFGKFNISDGASHTLTLDSTNSYIEIQSYNDPLYLNRQGNDVITNGSFGVGGLPSGAKAHVHNGMLKVTGNSIDTILSYSNVGIVGTQSNHDLTLVANNTEQVRVKASGEVLMPNQPSFAATGTATSVGVSTETVLPFDVVIQNEGNHFSTSTHRFTAPVAGKYLFYCSYLNHPYEASSFATVFISKNGGPINAGGMSRKQPKAQETTETMTILDLAEGDYVEARINPAGTSYYYLQSGHGIFLGHFLG